MAAKISKAKEQKKQERARKIFGTIIFVLTVLTVNLLSTYIRSFFEGFKYVSSPMLITWIGMTVIIIVYYPLFKRLDKFVKTVTGNFIKAGKSLIGPKIGLYVTFFVLLLILHHFYAQLWFGIDTISLFKKFSSRLLSNL